MKEITFKARIPPDSHGYNALQTTISYRVILGGGELDVEVTRIGELSAIVRRGAGKGARPEVNEGLRDRAKLLALHHYFMQED